MTSTSSTADLKGSYRTATARVAWWLRRIQWPTFLGIALAIAAVISGIITYLSLTGATDFTPTRGQAIAMMLVNLALVLTLLAFTVPSSSSKPVESRHQRTSFF